MGKKIIAELILSDEISVLSNSKEIQPEPEKVKPNSFHHFIKGNSRNDSYQSGIKL